MNVDIKSSFWHFKVLYKRIFLIHLQHHLIAVPEAVQGWQSDRIFMRKKFSAIRLYLNVPIDARTVNIQIFS